MKDAFQNSKNLIKRLFTHHTLAVIKTEYDITGNKGSTTDRGYDLVIKRL